MSLYAISRKDGGVSIMKLIEATDVLLEIDKWKKIHPDEYVSHRPLNNHHIPKDDTYRDAWCDPNENILEIDISKAKQIHLNIMRKERKPLLEYLDVQILKAFDDDKEDLLNSLKQKRKILRDITESLKSLHPTTLDEIKQVGSLENMRSIL